MDYIKNFNEFVNEDITKRELDKIESIADKMFAKYNIDVDFTKHFIERVNDTRNKPEITSDELIDMFKKMASKLGGELKLTDDEIQAVVKDLSSNLNLPIVFKPNKRDDDELIAKTIMRKKNFTKKGSDKLYQV